MAQLICLGEAIIELNQQPNGEYKSGLGGDVSNVAIAAARSGISAQLISALGQDSFANQFRTLWSNEGVQHSCVLSNEQHPTGKYYVTHDSDGHHFSYQRKGSAASFYLAQQLPLAQIQQADISYASGISLAISESMSDAVFCMFKEARSAGKLCAFDPNFRPALWDLDLARQVSHKLMENCDIALPGFEDAKLLTGLSDPDQIINFYHDLGASVVALTLGEKGVLVSDNKIISHVASQSVVAIDATGAGDCFNGAFLAEYLICSDVFNAATYANIAAGLSTRGYGAVEHVPRRAEILERLAMQL